MIKMTNPKRAGDIAVIKVCRPDGAQMWMPAGSNAMRYAKRNAQQIIERAGQFFAVAHAHPMAELFAACKGRVEAIRKINGMEDAVWNR